MDIKDKEIEDVRNSDLSPAMIESIKKPKKTWFFERMGDGFIFACEEAEAWEIVNNRSNWKRRDFKLLGTSDGSTYQRIVSESLKRARELEPIIAHKKEELTKYNRAEENLIMNEAVDMEGDPGDKLNEANKQKVLRIRKIVDRIHDDLDKLEGEYKSVVRGVIEQANAAELEVAKKNNAKRKKDGLGPDWPDQDLNIITPDADPRRRKKILSIMEGRRE